MSSFNNVPPQLWMLQSKAVRALFVEKFKLIRTGASEIRDQEIVSDGYTVYDLQHITFDKLIDYVGPQETFASAWEAACKKAIEELNSAITTEPQKIIDSQEVPAGTEPVLIAVEEVPVINIPKKINAKENK